MEAQAQDLTAAQPGVPLTRKTLFRLLVGLKMLAAGNPSVFYCCIPKKRKRIRQPLFIREALLAMAIQLDNYFSVAGRFEFDKRYKIGDFVAVRKPARFRG